MIILSNCFTETIDEGCIKVANSLARRIKKRYPDTTIISYERQSKYADIHMKLNKLFLNMELIRCLRENKETVMYIPFTRNTMASIVRTWILSKYARGDVIVVFAGCYDMNLLARTLLRWSKAKIVALAKESYETYQKIVGDKAIYLKAGVDTKQFFPVDKSKKKTLRKKYGVPEEAKMVMHVGHLEEGRNIAKLCKLDKGYDVYLVLSTTTENMRDDKLRKMLEKESNITIWDCYLENIEEIYQISDAYFFPVQQKENCIDIPLSVMEAAACNIPVVCTDYGELKEFKNEKGFFFLSSLKTQELNQKVELAINQMDCNNRSVAMHYDWDNALEMLVENI